MGLLQLALAAAAISSAPPAFPANETSGPISAWAAQWHGAVGEPFRTPWSTQLLWKKQGCPLSCVGSHATPSAA